MKKEVKELIDSLPSLKKLYDDITKGSQLFSSLPFLVNKKQKEEISSLKDGLEQLAENAYKYNKYFSNNGWIVYDSLDTELIASVVELYEKEGASQAEQRLINYYKNKENLTFINALIHGNDEFFKRKKILKVALKNHFEGNYIASVPLFLIIADGVVDEFTKSKGFFSGNTNTTAWDCMVGIDNGLQKLKNVYTKTRKKINTEEITLPYRHGVLHGKDLNFGNEQVSCKCLVLLFSINDWIKHKKDEDIRKEKFEKELEPVKMSELLAQNKKLKKDNAEIDKWEKQEFVVGKDIPISGELEDYNQFPFIYNLVEMLYYWKHKNYGKLHNSLRNIFKNKPIKECRKVFEGKLLEQFKIIHIEDKAISMKVIQIEVQWKQSDEICIEKLVFAMVAQNKKGDIVLPTDQNANWVIVPRDIAILF